VPPGVLVAGPAQMCLSCRGQAVGARVRGLASRVLSQKARPRTVQGRHGSADHFQGGRLCQAAAPKEYAKEPPEERTRALSPCSQVPRACRPGNWPLPYERVTGGGKYPLGLGDFDNERPHAGTGQPRPKDERPACRRPRGQGAAPLSLVGRAAAIGFVEESEQDSGAPTQGSAGKRRTAERG
jgi:hypothetical protein